MTAVPEIDFAVAAGDTLESKLGDGASFSVSPAVGVLSAHSTLQFEFSFEAAVPKVAAIVADLMIQGSVGPGGVRISAVPEVDLGASPLARQPPLRVQLAGRCEAYAAQMVPPVVHFGSEIEQGKDHKYEVLLENNSSTPFAFAMDMVNTPVASVAVSPAIGTVPANSAQRLMVVVTPTACGVLSSEILCSLPGGLTLSLPIHATVAPTVVAFDVPVVNFGLARVGKPVTASISLTNLSAVPTEWALSLDPMLSIDTVTAAETVTIGSTSGTLDAHARGEVVFTFCTQKAGKLDAAVRCVTPDNEVRVVQIIGEAVLPSACWAACRLDLGIV